MVERHLPEELWAAFLKKVESQMDNDPDFKRRMETELARIQNDPDFTRDTIEGMVYGMCCLAERELVDGVTGMRALNESVPCLIYYLHRMGFKWEAPVLLKSEQEPSSLAVMSQADIDAAVEKMLRRSAEEDKP